MNSRIKSLSPLLNRVLIKRLLPEQKTKGGIILSDKAADKDARFGQVVATGPGALDDSGKIIPLIVKVGEIVLLPESHYATKVSMEDTESEYLLVRDSEILGIVEGYKH
jgi:chaperonin GroES